MARLSSLLVDLTPLRRSRDFRLLWSSQVFTSLGRQVTVVALPFQVYVTTHSSLAVGLIGLAQLLPLLVTGFYAGAISDRYDRRLVQLAGKATAFAAAVALTAGAGLRLEAWWFYVWAAVGSAGGTLDQTARAATFPRLVSRSQYPAAAAMNQMLFQGAAVIGPSLAGLVIASAGAAPAFAVEAVCLLPSALLVLAVSRQAPGHDAAQVGWRAPVEGIRFVLGRRLLVGIFAADLIAMILGLPLAVFPALALSVFRLGPTGLGLLYAAPGAGAVAASLLSGWVGRIRRQGLAVIVAIVVWGVAIAAFGFSGRLLPLGLVLLAVAGGADVFSAIFRNSILQLSIPDAMRGRMSAFNLVVVTGGPRLGDLEAGLAAYLVNPVFSVVSGGVGCVVGILALAALLPELRRQRAAGADQPTPISSTAKTNVALGGIGPTPREP
jgi:predicted MFS family arabinose efflux permease